ncbi:MAG: hypothetical protein AB1349_08505 [Elusimicrobiota bacterium]
MKKISFIFLLLTFNLLPTPCLYAEPFPKNADTEQIYKNLEKIAQLSGKTTLWENTIKETPTRLDLAVFLNQCLVSAEEKNIEIPDELVAPLLAEFDRELLLLDIQNQLNKQDSYLNKLRRLVYWRLQFSFAAEQLAGSFPITERELTLYGAPPPSSVISFSQQVRLSLLAGTEFTHLLVGLKNFGFWGIGKYSSGATGINFASSDPPSIEELIFQTGNNNLAVNIGRRYLRLGEFGLSVDYLITPIESIQFSGKKREEKTVPPLSADILIGARYDSPDYYATRIGVGPFGIIGFISAIRKSYRTKYNLTNDKGLGVDLSFRFWANRHLKAEYSYYKPADSSEFHSWVCGIDLLSSKKMSLTILYGNLANIPQQSIPINRLPLEFVDKKFLRVQSNSRGPNLFLSYKLPYQFDGNYEFLYLDRKGGIGENDILRRHTVRFTRQIFGRAESWGNSYFVLEDFYTTEGTSNYNTARCQIVFNF